MINFKHDKYTRKAIEMAREGHSFFITGKAGTGKTMLLRKIVEEEKSYGRNVAVCAPTGVAAKNAGGVTIHSLLRVPISIYIPGHMVTKLYNLPKEEQEVVRVLDLLIIDEVSMVRCDLMDMVDEILRHYRRTDKPFGGLQVIMFGDLKQLMPVAKEEDWAELGKYYKEPYFFCSDVIKNMSMPMLELTKVHRQSDNDFISMLNNIRDGKLTYEDKQVLDSRFKKDFEVSDALHYIRLTTHNFKAKKYNSSKLEGLRGQEFEYKAFTEGYYPMEEKPNDYVLHLKANARVMFIANDRSGQYVNGTLGTVEYADEENIEVRTDEGKLIDVTKNKWDIYRYKINKERKEIERVWLGSFIQYPLRLAWAVTIHKSQGLTFDKVIIDAGKAFAYGQVYVALSRCKTLDGIVLTSLITPEIVKSHPLVLEYMQLVEHIWPEEDTEHEQFETDFGKDEIEKLDYKPIGHVFKAPWDGAFYDAWEDVSGKYYVDKLVQKDGELHRLCVGIIGDKRSLFEILSNRDYKKIISWRHLGGTSSIIDAIIGGKLAKLNFTGFKYQEKEPDVHDTVEIWDRTPHLRSYDFTRKDDILKIRKSSNNSFPSEIKVSSDMGKLLLCCDCYKILRNDNHSYDVGVDDGKYKVLHFTLEGKALDDESKMIADKWYQKNKGKANIKKSYEVIPETRSTIKTRASKPIKQKQVVTPLMKNHFAKFPADSIERKILECMLEQGLRYAHDIANEIGFTRKEVNSKLYGILSADGYVETVFNTWRLKKE